MPKETRSLMYAGQCRCVATARPARSKLPNAPDSVDGGESAVGSELSIVGQRTTTDPAKTAPTKPALSRQVPSMNGMRPKAHQMKTSAATKRPQNESKWKKS